MNTELHVGDAVKVYAPPPYYEYYIIGRIIYIETNEKEDMYEYGVLYYGRHRGDPQNSLLTLHTPSCNIKKMPVEHPPSCPSHSFTMDYVDELIEKERDESS